MWKELRTRWMYWRYRNITRFRQRMQLKWAARKSRNPVYMAPGGRGIRPVRPTAATGMARTWILLILVSIGMATVEHFSGDGTIAPDVALLANIGILAAAFGIWTVTK